LDVDQDKIGYLAYELGYFGDYNDDGIADFIIAEKLPPPATPIGYDKTNTKIHFFKYDKT